MKILFYVEPHGVRDSFTSHSLPFNYFCGIARQLYLLESDEVHHEARVFSNHFVSTANFNGNYDAWPLVIQPNKDEQRSIEDMARLWMGQGMNDWVALMTQPSAPITEFYVSMLKRIHKEEFAFDVIVTWGENMAVREAARGLGANVVFFELASMRAPFLQSVLIDAAGVNGAASVPAMRIEDIKGIFQPLPLSVVPLLLNEEFADGKQNTVLPNALNVHMSGKLTSLVGGSRKVALVPLQLADDANQLLYSDFTTVDAFATAAIEPLIASGFQVILKPHPHARLRGGYVMGEQWKVMEKFGRFSEVTVLSEDDNSSEYLPLLRGVDLVVTNNSSAGFEAMMLDTPVVAMGRAAYAPIAGLPDLDQAIRSFSDHELAEHFQENRAHIVTYMLGCCFPLRRRLAEQLIKRVETWLQYDVKSRSCRERLAHSIGWDTWHQKDFMRAVTGLER